jgi:hypothetical protein
MVIRMPFKSKMGNDSHSLITMMQDAGSSSLSFIFFAFLCRAMDRREM